MKFPDIKFPDIYDQLSHAVTRAGCIRLQENSPTFRLAQAVAKKRKLERVARRKNVPIWEIRRAKREGDLAARM